MKKQAINVASDPEPEQPPLKTRHTRINALLKKERNRAEGFANTDKFKRDLLEKQTYIDDRCRNLRGYYFINYSGKHYSMNYSQQRSWAMVITNRDVNVSLIYPPKSLYNFWTQRQGAIIDESKKPIQQIER